MKYILKSSPKFRKSIKRIIKSKNYKHSEFLKVINTLLEGKKLEAKYKNHKLFGEYENCFECHMQNDILLVYYYIEKELVLYAVDIGTHSELF